jgi:tetratricopeptide (TPR) repeat protein
LRTGFSATTPGADELLAQSIEVFRTFAGSSERIPSPVNIAEVTSEHEGRPGLRLVFEDTLQPFVEISCDAAVSDALANQAGIARERGELARALRLLDESAARFEAAGDEPGQAAVLVRRAYFELAEGALPAARAHLESALELRRRLGDRRGLGLVLSGLGLIDTTAGDYDSAEQHLAEARDIFRRAGDRWGLASTLWRTADLAFARGSLDDAEAALQEARAVLGETQRERWIANTLSGLAEVALLRGDVDQASVLLADARGRYAARDDALGVSNVEDRLRSLAKDSAKAGLSDAG